MNNNTLLNEARATVVALRAQWQALVAAGKNTKAAGVAEDLEFWSNRAAFLAQVAR